MPTLRAARHAGRFALTMFAVALLVGCVSGLDAQQVRVCRSALPALNPEATITVRQISAGPASRSLRIDYEAAYPGRPIMDRFAICRFAAEGLSPNKADLVDLATEQGPLSGASLYLLKRYYLDSPEGTAGDPGSPPALSAPEIPASLAYVGQQLLAGLPRTAIYGLLAVASSLVFGLTGRINLAFGEIAAIGAAATIGAASILLAGGWSAPAMGLAAGLVAAMFAGAIYNAVGGYFVIGRIKTRSNQPSLIATVGLSLFLMEFLRLAQSPVTVWLPPVCSAQWPVARSGSFLVTLTLLSLVTSGIGLVAAGFLIWLMKASPFGRAWRAFADDARAAALFGVDGTRLLIQTLALAGAMAGLSGMLIVAQYGGLGFAGGFQFGLKALIAAIVGGIGSVPGALVVDCSSACSKRCGLPIYPSRRVTWRSMRHSSSF